MYKLTKWLVISLTFFICAHADDFSFKDVQFAKEKIKGPYGVIYAPRNYLPRYRGQEAALYSAKEAILSMLEIKPKVVGSLAYTAVKLALLNELDNHNDAVTRMIRYRFCKNWGNEGVKYNPNSSDCYFLDNTYIGNDYTLRDGIENLKKDITVNESNVSKITFELLDKALKNKGKSQIISEYANYQSKNYNDFPSDMVFTSVYPQIARVYGDTIIVTKDLRSLDLSFFNGKLNNYWPIWGDAGEFITPIGIKPNDIIGIHLHKRGDYSNRLKNYVSIADYSVQKNFAIEYALYKLNNSVFIFDGSGKFCIRLSRQNEVVFCNETTPLHLSLIHI